MPQPEFQSGRCGATDDLTPASRESARAAVGDCRVWLNWAAAQIDACLANDNLASGQLLAMLADLLARVQPRLGTPSAPANDAVSEQVSAVIIAAQSHDRVMQGLTHVAQSLRALREQLGDEQRAESADSWRLLRENQFRAFTMAEERELFARLVAHEHEGTREIAANRADTVELFTSVHGRQEP
jgi:hypothetical protein